MCHLEGLLHTTRLEYTLSLRMPPHWGFTTSKTSKGLETGRQIQLERKRVGWYETDFSSKVLKIGIREKGTTIRLVTDSLLPPAARVTPKFCVSLACCVLGVPAPWERRAVGLL